MGVASAEEERFMADRTPPSAESKLESWKAIAGFLNRDERTVRRWERFEGLPVHRHRHLTRSSVYAYPSELDAWRETRGTISASSNSTARRLAAIAVTLVIAALTAGGGRFDGPLAAQSQAVDRVMWTSPHDLGQISPDGKYVTYVDWSSFANLSVRDLAAKTSRQLTSNTSWTGGQADSSTISPDGRQVAYAWHEQSPSIRLVRLDGGTDSSPKTLAVFDPAEVRLVSAHDWSRDGEWIAISQRRVDGTGRIALVSTRDGSVRFLGSSPWHGPSGLRFSPDSRFLAYALPRGNDAGSREILLLSVDTGVQTTPVSHHSRNIPMGWSPDGRLLFASDRTGMLALWSLRIVAGTPGGEPIMVRSEIPSASSLGMTVSGALYLQKSSGAPFVKIVRIDAQPGTASSSPVVVYQQFIESRGWPDWSADGSVLTYNSCGRGGGGPCTLMIRSTATGDVRELEPALAYFQYPRVAPDGRSVTALGYDYRGQGGVYLIDIASGAASLLVRADTIHRPGAPTWSPDGRKIYYGERNAPGVRILERDVSDGTDRVVFDGQMPCDSWAKLAPDARHLACVSRDQTSLVVASLPEGQARPIFRVDAPQKLGSWNWAPDSRSIVVTKLDPQEHWLVSLNGDAKRMEIENGGDIRLSPDGRHVAYVGMAGNPGAEVWALENVLVGSAPR
jgi:Tol biopolymer transport system component